MSESLDMYAGLWYGNTLVTQVKYPPNSSDEQIRQIALASQRKFPTMSALVGAGLHTPYEVEMMLKVSRVERYCDPRWA